MPNGHNDLGKGAIVEVWVRNLRPKKDAEEIFRNEYKVKKILDCLVTGETEIKEGKSEIHCLVLRHESFGQKDFFVPFGASKFVKAGPPSEFFRAQGASVAAGWIEFALFKWLSRPRALCV